MHLFSDDLAVRLDETAKRHAGAYRTNQPFPHIVIDDFLPPSLLEGVVRDFPEPDRLAWIEFDKREEKKLAFNQVERLPASIRDVLLFMNSAPMLRFLEQLTGIEALMPDPHFIGGGLHQIRRGGHLGVHVDFNKHKLFGLDRRLNLLLYLNQDWPDTYGGCLELWDEKMEKCVKRVLPVFNRCVVFSTTETSYHGHPEPLTCPDERARRSLATYYYTNGRSDGSAKAHSTVFRARPGDESLGQRVADVLRRGATALTPPIVTSAVRKLRKR